jgi:sporulation related protein/tetratricopeptide repeat protein
MKNVKDGNVGTWIREHRWLLLAVATLSNVPTLPLSAQTDPRLKSAVTLAQSGRMDSARAVVRRLLAAMPPTDSVYPEALYVSGILAPDPQTVATYLQRVMIEYGQSPWADDALLRLAQLYAAQGDDAATIKAVERLRSDYPESPVLARASFVGARAYFTLKDDAHGCLLIREVLGSPTATTDVEFRNQVAFYAPRCSGVQAPAAPVAVATAATTPRDTGSFAVQVLAVRSSSQVDEMLTRLKVMGYTARVVRDSSGLFKVRVGKYATRDEAQRALSNLRTRLGGQPFLVDEP